jgi:hypothetical protein
VAAVPGVLIIFIPLSSSRGKLRRGWQTRYQSRPVLITMISTFRQPVLHAAPPGLGVARSPHHTPASVLVVRGSADRGVKRLFLTPLSIFLLTSLHRRASRVRNRHLHVAARGHKGLHYASRGACIPPASRAGLGTRLAGPPLVEHGDKLLELVPCMQGWPQSLGLGDQRYTAVACRLPVPAWTVQLGRLLI